MSIYVNPTKSREEIRWIESLNDYQSHLIKIAEKSYPESKELLNAVVSKDWHQALQTVHELEDHLASKGLFFKGDLLSLSIEMPKDCVWNSSTSGILAEQLLTSISLLEKSAILSNKLVNADISPLITHTDTSIAKTYQQLFLYYDVLFTPYNRFTYSETISQIIVIKNNAELIASRNLIALIGFFQKILQHFIASQKHDNTNRTNLILLEEENFPPPIVAEDGNAGNYASLRIGRRTKISFHRTLRVPEDGNDYPLPADLGSLPIHRVEDFADRVPIKWLEEGGFFMPLYQKEALFVEFDGDSSCPSIAKVCVGGINAITGKTYSEKLSSHVQDYLVIPEQKWLDGVNSGNGSVRQFVAMPLGEGYTIEAQITDEEKHGGFQLVVFEPIDGRFPESDYSLESQTDLLKRQAMMILSEALADYPCDTQIADGAIPRLNKREKAVIEALRTGALISKVAFITGLSNSEVVIIYDSFRENIKAAIQEKAKLLFSDNNGNTQPSDLGECILYQIGLQYISDAATLFSSPSHASVLRSSPAPWSAQDEMGIAAGGRLKQQICADRFGIESWNYNRRRVIEIHMVNSLAYMAITGKECPPTPVTIEQYKASGIPWYSHYDETVRSLKGSSVFKNLLTLAAIDKRRGRDVSAQSQLQITPNLIQRIKTPDVHEATKEFRQRAHESAKSGKWKTAIREINYLIDIKTEIHASDYALRSFCNYQMQMYHEGLVDGYLALELDAHCADALISSSRCRLALRDSAGLLEDANKLILNPETELMGLCFRAEAFLLSGRYDDAICDALSLTKKSPGHWRAGKILDEARSRITEHSK